MRTGDRYFRPFVGCRCDAPEMDAASFLDAENWTGGFYELAIDTGEQDDGRLGAALLATWNDSALDGCYADRNIEPPRQQRIPPSLRQQELHGHLLGRAELPGAKRTVCGSVVIGEHDGPNWLVFYIPLGSLARVDSRVGGYPFEASTENSLAWRRPIDTWLERIAQRVFADAPFRLALIGHEASCAVSSAELGAIPDERSVTYLVPSNRELLAHAATQ